MAKIDKYLSIQNQSFMGGITQNILTAVDSTICFNVREFMFLKEYF